MMFYRRVSGLLIISFIWGSPIGALAQQQRPFTPNRPLSSAQRNSQLQQSATHSIFLPYQPPPPPQTPSQVAAAKQLADSLPYLIAKSKAGDADATYLVGRAHELGLFNPDHHPDPQKAVYFTETQ